MSQCDGGKLVHIRAVKKTRSTMSEKGISTVSDKSKNSACIWYGVMPSGNPVSEMTQDVSSVTLNSTH